MLISLHWKHHPPIYYCQLRMFEMLYGKASHDAYGMASAFAVEESVMLRMLTIGKFQLTVQDVVQSFQIPCWLTCKKLGNLTKKVIPRTSTMWVGCAPVRKGVSQCGRVCPSVGGCAPVWEGVYQCGKVCPSEGGCAPVREGPPHWGRVCPSVGACSQV